MTFDKKDNNSPSSKELEDNNKNETIGSHIKSALYPIKLFFWDMLILGCVSMITNEDLNVTHLFS